MARSHRVITSEVGVRLLIQMSVPILEEIENIVTRQAISCRRSLSGARVSRATGPTPASGVSPAPPGIHHSPA